MVARINFKVNMNQQQTRKRITMRCKNDHANKRQQLTTNMMGKDT